MTLKHSFNETALLEGTFPTPSILAHFTKLEGFCKTQDKSPVGKSENGNSDEPEEKEEKNENNEDRDHSVHTGIQLISYSDVLSCTIGLFSTDKSLITTPLYILFHSWKLDLA